MNILFFLKPKAEVAFVYDYHTLRQAMEIMEYHKYSSIPMINREGKYVGTITEGDLLWGLKKLNILNLKGAEDVAITKIARRADYRPVSADSNMEDLLDKAINQNYVPVVDDKGSFIGIITRKEIIKYCYKEMKKLSGLHEKQETSE